MIVIHHDCEIKLTFENKLRLLGMIKRVILYILSIIEIQFK